MPYTPFRSRRGIRHLFLIGHLERFWRFFWRSSFGLKLILVGAIAGVVGIIFPWATGQNQSHYSAFSAVCGGVGWVIAVLLGAVFVTLFSYDLQEKTKKYFGIVLHPKTLYVRVGYLIMTLAVIINIALIGVARTLGADIQLSLGFSGMVWTFISSIALIIGGKLVAKSEKKQSYNHVFVHGVEPEEDDAYRKILGSNDEEDNMKLPI